jgi:hypothetical protein
LKPHSIRFGFEGSVLNHGEREAERVLHPSCALLNNVGQLVAQEPLALGRIWVELSRGEVQVRPMREGQGSDRRRLRTHVNVNVREAGLEERLHLLPHRIGQRLA